MLIFLTKNKIGLFCMAFLFSFFSLVSGKKPSDYSEDYYEGEREELYNNDSNNSLDHYYASSSGYEHQHKYSALYQSSRENSATQLDENDELIDKSLVDSLIDAVQESIALMIKVIKKEIWGKGLFIRIIQFIEGLIYAIIVKVAFYVLTNPVWLWAYIGRLAGINNGIRDALLTGEIWEKFAWKAFYSVLVSISLSCLKTFVQSSIGQKRSQKTTLKRVTAVAIRTLSIWIAIYEPLQLNGYPNFTPIASSSALLIIFMLAELTLTPVKRKKASIARSLIRGMVKGVSSYIAILGCSFALAKFYLKREEHEIEKEKNELRNLITSNFYRLRQENNQNNEGNNPNNEPVGIIFLFNLIGNLLGGNEGNNEEIPSFEDFINEQKGRDGISEEEQQQIQQEIAEAIEQYEKKYEENIKYSLIADGGSRILFVFELLRVALVSETYQKVKESVLSNLRDQGVDLSNQGIIKFKEIVLKIREKWNQLWRTLPTSFKTVTEVLFYNTLIATNPYI
ncbi:MAG: hypothetical protein AAF770_02815 [Bacteroidota bacterium]